MPLKYFRHKLTGEIIRSLKGSPSEDYEEILSCPNGKFMIASNKATGKSKLKDSEKVLMERARNHSRDNDLDDNISLNRDNDLGVKQNLLNKKGERRRKIDDI